MSDRGGWKEKSITEPSMEFQAYRDMMSRELKKRYEPKPSSTTQCKSTTELLALSDEETAKRREQLFDQNFWLELKERSGNNKSREQIEKEQYGLIADTVQRVGLDQISHHESIRRGAKNNLGQSEISGSCDERKESARQAFTCTPPVPLNEVEKERLTRIEPITELKKYHWKTLTRWQAFKHWLKGGKVKRGHENET